MKEEGVNNEENDIIMWLSKPVRRWNDDMESMERKMGQEHVLGRLERNSS